MFVTFALIPSKTDVYIKLSFFIISVSVIEPNLQIKFRNRDT